MKNKIVSFQILRAAAITLIFLSHCEKLLLVDNNNCLFYLGGAGVSLFIALSGFLTARKYDDKQCELPMELYKVRWKQFYFSHYLTMVIAIPLTLSVLKSNPVKWTIQLIVNSTLTQVIFPSKGIYFSFNAVSWYCSLMLAFAFLTPLAVRIWKRLSIKNVVILTIGGIGFEFLLVILLGNRNQFHWLAYIFPITRFLDFIMGGGYYTVAKYIEEKQLFKLNWITFITFVFVLIGLIFLSCISGNNFFLTAVWTVPATMIVMSLYSIEFYCERNVIIKSIVIFGNISFEFFLVHQLSIRYIGIIFERLNISVRFAYLLAFVSSVIAAVLITSVKAKRRNNE